jgi:hypothetical protein
MNRKILSNTPDAKRLEVLDRAAIIATHDLHKLACAVWGPFDSRTRRALHAHMAVLDRASKRERVAA